MNAYLIDYLNSLPVAFSHSLSLFSDYGGGGGGGGVQLQGCCSQSSLNSNGSLTGAAGAHRRLSDQRVASWAACFERLLQDPIGVRYFSVREGEGREGESFHFLPHTLFSTISGLLIIPVIISRSSLLGAMKYCLFGS